MATASVNPDYLLEEGTVAIKDYKASLRRCRGWRRRCENSGSGGNGNAMGVAVQAGS